MKLKNHTEEKNQVLDLVIRAEIHLSDNEISQARVLIKKASCLNEDLIILDGRYVPDEYIDNTRRIRQIRNRLLFDLT